MLQPFAKPLCTNDAYVDGKWIHTNESIANTEIARLRHEFVACKDHSRGCLWRNDAAAARTVSSLSYKWEPRGCRLNPITPIALPAWLRARDMRLIFVGDSTTTDFADGLTRCGGVFDSGMKDTVHIVRSDLLGVRKLQQNDKLSVEEALVSARKFWSNLDGIRIKQTDTIVLNAGAHWHGQKSSEEVQKLFARVAQVLWELQPRAVVFRTIVMGHNGCENFQRPFERITAKLRANLTSRYNWKDFDWLNTAIKRGFSEVWPPSRFHVLNTSMFSFRGDGHHDPPKDCLHYCVPGAADKTWGDLLTHHLREKFE